MRIFSITFDPTEVELAAEKLGAIRPEDFGAAALGAVNEVADRTWDKSLSSILNGINLTQDQVLKRMTRTRATDPARPTASISAARTASPLSSYGAQMPTTQVNWTNAFIEASGLPTGKWPRWTPRVGRPNVGIKPDQKAVDGVSVEVIRGSRKNLKHGFLIVGKNGQTLLATRPKGGARGSYEVRYGPAVHQLFRHALDEDFLQQVEADLSKSIADALGEKVTSLLT